VSARAVLALGLAALSTGARWGEGAFDRAPVVVWERHLPGPRFPSAVHAERGAPVIRGDRIYVGSAADSALYVLARSDGTLLRRIETGGPVQSAVVVEGDHLWFGDAAGYTWCTDLEGTVVWKHFSGAPILASPTLSGGRVYVSNVDSLVVALDQATGQLVWRHAQKLDPGRTAELQLYASPSPLVTGDLVLTGYADGTIAALSIATGEMAWQRRVGEGRYPDISANPIGRATDVIVGGYTEPLLAFDLQSRNVRWRLDVGSAAAPTLDPNDGRTVYHAGVDGILQSVDGLTGATAWSWDSETKAALTTPLWTEAGLLVGSSAGGLYLISPNDGTERWRLDTGNLLAGVSAEPAIDGRQVVILTNAGNLVSLVAPGGTRDGG
jgi:outer membrane protein assembly factor BamB